MPSSLDEVPFDLEGTESDSQDEVDAIFTAMGFTKWADAFAAWEDEPHSTWRTVRFQTAEEALIFAFERKILNFTKIVYYPGNPLPYGWVVGDSV